MATALFLTGCDDAFGPQPWAFLPDTVDLYSLSRVEHMGRPAGLDLVNLTPVVVEALRETPAVFDLVLAEGENGEFQLLPAGLFTAFTITPGLQVVSPGTFEGIGEAPRDGYSTDEPVPAETGVVYVVRTRTTGSGCTRYGKLEILELNDDGTARVRAIRNPNCNDRDLVPTVDPDEEED